MTEYENIRNSKRWVTANNKHILVKDLELHHIQNIMIVLTKKQQTCADLGLGPYRLPTGTANEWLKILASELLYRKDKELVSNTKLERVDIL